jgi:hypothetical protein
VLTHREERLTVLWLGVKEKTRRVICPAQQIERRAAVVGSRDIETQRHKNTHTHREREREGEKERETERDRQTETETETEQRNTHSAVVWSEGEDKTSHLPSPTTRRVGLPWWAAET